MLSEAAFLKSWSGQHDPSAGVKSVPVFPLPHRKFVFFKDAESPIYICIVNEPHWISEGCLDDETSTGYTLDENHEITAESYADEDAFINWMSEASIAIGATRFHQGCSSMWCSEDAGFTTAEEPEAEANADKMCAFLRTHPNFVEVLPPWNVKDRP